MLVLTALFATLIVSLALPAFARARVNGDIEAWNPIKNRYEPLRHARIRWVLAEYYDADTFDVEGSTDSNGHYALSKGNAWWRSGYDAYLIVFAEASNKLEVQSHYMQVDGYQVVSPGFFARDNRTTTKNMKIGGPSPVNVRKYQVGGVAALNNSSNTSTTRGSRAFIIYSEMTDHRKQLQSKALSSGNFEEKEVSYPVSDDVASYVRILDYIKIPDHYFTSGDMARASLTCRHELSHGIMADEYWTWPGWMMGSAGSHTLGKVAEEREYAWSEAWAEFMAEVTQRPRYGNYYDFETQDAGWRSGIPAGADRSYIEGELASVLWDIHDGLGWEKRYQQTNSIPGDEMFYDGISDGNLTKIWRIVKDFHPHGVTHTSYLGSADNFVHYWLSRTSYGQRHELKAILYNRGITVPQLPEHGPTLSLGAITWTGNTARIPVTVREQDAIDRERVRLELFLNDIKVHSEWLTSGWSGDTCHATINQEVAYTAGDPKPRLQVVVHDDMLTQSRARVLDPPAGAQMGGLLAEVLAVTVRQEIDTAWLGPSAADALVRNVVVNVTARDGSKTTSTRMPPSGGWSVAGDDQYRDETTRTLYQNTGTPGYIELVFNTTGQGPAGSLNQRVTKRYDRAANFGLGTHEARVLNVQWNIGPALFGIEGRIRVSVVYRIRAVKPALKPILAAQVLARMLPTIARSRMAVRLGTPAAAKLVTVQAARPSLVPPETATPTVLLSRSSQLMDEYARLQAEAYEMAQEVEHRLANQPPQVKPPGPTIMRPRPGIRRTPTLRTPAPIKGPTVARQVQLKDGLLKLPRMQALDRAAVGQLALRRLTDEQRTYLQDLQKGIQERQARLPEIQTASLQLKGRLDAALARIEQDPQVDAKGRSTARAKVQRVTVSLGRVRPTAPEFTHLMRQQQQALDKGLKLPR